MKFYSTTVTFALLGALIVATQIDAKNNNNQQARAAATRGGAGRRGKEVARNLQTGAGDSNKLLARPVQTFYVPLPEESMFKDMFYQINPKKARPPIVSLISFAISTDNTWIWYDQHEDGYDDDVMFETSKTTQIWGDGKAENGCAPTVTNCTNGNDYFYAGDTVVIQETVELPRNTSHIRYDGGDRIQASFPIAVTRGSYPEQPGSLMAGAVEVLDTNNWGYKFEAPVGMNIGRSFQAFQITALFFMAQEDNTEVTLPNRKKIMLNQGEGSMVRVNQADILQSDKLIQVDLITGDVWSYYELRWYSLLSVEKYSTAYYSPVGDTFGKTKVLLYYPGPKRRIQYEVEYRDEEGILRKYRKSLSRNRAALSTVIPTNSGAKITGTGPFIALSLTDSESYASDGQYTGSQWYDWGFPVVPIDQLTPQVLIGWGFGCTDNDCHDEVDRSVVWVSPVRDAKIYVDFSNSGAGTSTLETHTLKRLESVKLSDPNDDDMSGAIIYAEDDNGDPVDIAAAWGQDPAVSYKNQSISLDLGTVVLPFTVVKVSKLVDKSHVNRGGDLEYTIRVSNVGQKLVLKDHLTVKDELDPDVTYVAGTMKYKFENSGGGDDDGQYISIDDDTSGSTAFPLDDDGWTIPFDLPRRGGTIDIFFHVKVDENVEKSKIVNTGRLEQLGGSDLPFEAETKIMYEPRVNVQNTVYLGHDDGKCEDRGEEYQEGHPTSPVTYCFLITNNGGTSLNSFQLVNEDLSVAREIDVKLAPWETKMVEIKRRIDQPLENLVTVTANPVFASGADITGLGRVSDSDTSSVGILTYTPEVSIINTVYLGDDGPSGCDDAKSVQDIYGSKVVYCFNVTNNGDSHLKGIHITNNALVYDETFDVTLEPKESKMFTVRREITRDLENLAIVRANPTHPDGSDIQYLGDVQAEDDSEVLKITVITGDLRTTSRVPPLQATVSIKNTVYLGQDGGKKCGTTEAVEYVADYYGADVTYCFQILNQGQTGLALIEIVDDELNFTDSSIGDLAPGESSMISHEGTITDDIMNTANVTATAVLVSDGRVIPGIGRVTDEDPSSVGRKRHEPSVSIENKVFLGHNDGKSCGTGAAKEHVVDFLDEPATYCFTIKNEGTSTLDNIVVEDTKLGYKTKIEGLLAPGVATTVHHEDKISGDFDNTAVVKGTPVLHDGSVLPDQENVTDSDTSSIGKRLYVPEVTIVNKLYKGEDEGKACNTDKPMEEIEGYFGDLVVVCCNVTNQGQSYLDNFFLENEELGYNDKTCIKRLAPGESRMIPVPGIITDTVENHCRVTASPCKKDGTPLRYLGNVNDTDTSSVLRLAHSPSVSINNTVYIGADKGASCGTDVAVEKVEDIYFTDVVFCFDVQNNGDTKLMAVTVTNKELGFTKKFEKGLNKGEKISFSVSGKIMGDVVNTANVTANPVLADGTDIDDVDDVTASDPSEVTKLDFAASVSIQNQVYLGHEEKCDDPSALAEYVDGYYNANVTYCFEVANTGTSHLNKIRLSNKKLYYFPTVPGSLAPGESKIVPYPTTISEALCNFANVTANPITDDGRDIPDLSYVTASDPSGVGMLIHRTGVEINNTVYVGTDKEGAKCGTGDSEKVEDNYGTGVVYCLVVKNTGETALNTIHISDKEINFEKDIDEMLKPNETVTVPVIGKIRDNLVNMANVTAMPVLMDGSDIPHLGQVTDKDPSEVGIVAHKPSIFVENQVYIGRDDGAKCGTNEAEELVSDFPNTEITFCINVKNAGDSYLGDVTIDNQILNFSETVSKLAPQESKMFVVPRSITTTVQNEAVVTGNPVLESGEKIPDAQAVTDTDPSGVEKWNYSPSLSIDNRAYLGHDDGAKCGTKESRDFVRGIYKSKVTYCFFVFNTGNTTLTDISVDDPLLKFHDTTSIGRLAPLESATVFAERQITVDLVNNAIANAKPVTKELEEIEEFPSVTDEDTSEVDKLDFTAGIKVMNKVYLGHDGDAKCKTDHAQDNVRGIYDTDVSYCFLLFNTGDSTLKDIVLSNQELSFRQIGLEPLAPGNSTIVSLPKKIQETMGNKVKVTGVPVTSDLQTITDLGPVSCEDTSEVIKLDLKAGIEITNRVYIGRGDEANKCVDAENSAVGYYATEITFCLNVTNTSPETFLDGVLVTDEVLGVNDDSIGILAPLESKLIPVPNQIMSNIKNTAIATGNPSLEGGIDIPDLPNVTSSDESSVLMEALPSSIVIENKVYVGHDNGQSCDSAVEYVENYNGAAITYCFSVENDGDTWLKDVTIENPALDFQDSTIGTLSPGDTAVVAFSTTIDGSLVNNATVTGNPALETDEDIPGNDVSDSDTSSVGQLEYYPAINVENTVYIGDDWGASCYTSGIETVSGKNGEKIVYCFNITNSGDTWLKSIVLENAELNYTDNTIRELAPHASELIAFESVINGNLTNVAKVKANPTLENGADISGAPDVKDTDPSHVVEESPIDGLTKSGDKVPFSPPEEPDKCLQNNWDDAGNPGKLVCATRDVYLESLTSDKEMSCTVGDSITITIDASIRVDGAKNDLGWYVATDGGDALDGTCVVNGLQNGNTYNVVDSPDGSDVVGSVAWSTPNGGDGDSCGDVITDNAHVNIDIPFVVSTTMPCTDDNEDGVFDFAVCFTWRDDTNTDQCIFAKNIPAELTGGCLCTRFEVPNISVETPVDDPIAPC